MLQGLRDLETVLAEAQEASFELSQDPQDIPRLFVFAVTVCQQRGSAEGCESWAKHSGHCNKVLPFPSLFLRNKVGCCMAGLHAI